jgi:PIN domain nuclease of toxin-antitoxin system
LPGIRLEPLSPEIAIASTRLPGAIHADPCDRMIAATARQAGAILMLKINGYWITVRPDI